MKCFQISVVLTLRFYRCCYYFVGAEHDTGERNRRGKGHGRGYMRPVSRSRNDESEDVDHTARPTAASSCKS